MSPMIRSASAMAPSLWFFSFSWMMANSSPPRRAKHVGIAQRRAQPLRHLDQQLVAGGMSQPVVDALELVEIEHQHAKGGAVALQPLRGIIELFGEKRAVLQTGEQIVLREERETTTANNVVSLRARKKPR